jgi:hypothetical protein
MKLAFSGAIFLLLAPSDAWIVSFPESVKKLSFYRGQNARGPGEEGIKYLGPQLSCLSQSHCQPLDAVDCWKESRVWHWQCSSSSLPSYVEFDIINVDCGDLFEGKVVYESCRLEYSLRERRSVVELGQLATVAVGLVLISVAFMGLPFFFPSCVQRERIEVVVRGPSPRRSSPIRSTLRGEDRATEDDDIVCRICAINERCCVVVPCGHIVYCISCANKKLDNVCPLCRTKIENVIRIFN